MKQRMKVYVGPVQVEEIAAKLTAIGAANVMAGTEHVYLDVEYSGMSSDGAVEWNTQVDFERAGLWRPRGQDMNRVGGVR